MPGYTFGTFWFDIADNVVCEDTHPIPLSPQQKKLLLVLLKAVNKSVSKDQIIKALWVVDTTVGFDRSLAVQTSAVNTALKRKVIGRRKNGDFYVCLPVVYRDDPDIPWPGALPEINKFLTEERYSISPIGEYLPIYPVYIGLRRDEIEVKYQGEYEPPEDFLTLMERFPPDPPINQLYSFRGWEGEIPSEDELAGKEGRKLVLHVEGGTWHHVHTLTEIWKASNRTPTDPVCRTFRTNHLKRLFPLSSSSLYHNVNTQALVVTADDQIVVARRKGGIVCPGTWTTSIEEQMLRHRQKDGLSDEMDLFACAERGARGELGVTVISDSTRLLSVGLEFGNFTAAFLLLIQSAETFAQIATRTWPNASECDEAVALDALPARPDAIKAVLENDQYNPVPDTCVASPRWNSLHDPRTPGPWHPTAKARLDAYLRHLATTQVTPANKR